MTICQGADAFVVVDAYTLIRRRNTITTCTNALVATFIVNALFSFLARVTLPLSRIIALIIVLTCRPIAGESVKTLTCIRTNCIVAIGHLVTFVYLFKALVQIATLIEPITPPTGFTAALVAIGRFKRRFMIAIHAEFTHATIVHFQRT